MLRSCWLSCCNSGHHTSCYQVSSLVLAVHAIDVLAKVRVHDVEYLYYSGTLALSTYMIVRRLELSPSRSILSSEGVGHAANEERLPILFKSFHWQGCAEKSSERFKSCLGSLLMPVTDCRLVWVGPWLGMAFLYMVFVQQSHVALLVCALLFAETFLPIGQARTHPCPWIMPLKC